MIQIQNISKPDLLGAATSSLCAIHCMATPFLFLAQAGAASSHIETPAWYQLFDYLFIVISFVAVYAAARNSSKNWMRTALWATWAVLLIAILNETFEISHLPEAAVYIPALIIAGLHLYNRKYCRCADESCCVPTTQS